MGNADTADRPLSATGLRGDQFRQAVRDITAGTPS